MKVRKKAGVCSCKNTWLILKVLDNEVIEDAFDLIVSNVNATNETIQVSP